MVPRITHNGARSSVQHLAARLAASPATRWCLTLTRPNDGAAAHSCLPRGHGPPPGIAALHWAAAQTGGLEWLESDGCRHRRQEDRYRPSRLLRHLIRARQRTCCFPAVVGPLSGAT